MRRTKIAVLLTLTLGAGAAPALGQEVDDGFAYLREDTTWTKADSPVRIRGTVVVDDGVTLTIEPGVRTELLGLDVRGGLVAEGTPDEPVTFSGFDGRKWWGIRIEKVDGPRPSSAIRHVVIERASWGLAMHDPAFPVEDSTFRDNGTGLYVTDPVSSVSFSHNRFYSNDVGFHGRTTGFVGVYSNDFWDNDTSLLFEAQSPYACGNEPGVFDVRYNDILRGPGDEWYSFDVRTSDESGGSGMIVRVPDNWWGTTNTDDIQARMRPRIDCCPGPQRSPIEWREPAAVPQTAVEPPGPVGSPERPPEIHGDPAFVTDVRRPEHRDCLPSRSLRRLRGTTFPAVGSVPEKLEVGLVRMADLGCDSYDPATGRFSIHHSCGERVSFEVRIRDNRWVVRLRRPLGPGKYTFAAAGAHIVRFRVLRD